MISGYHAQSFRVECRGAGSMNHNSPTGIVRINLTSSFNRESIVNTEEAGILTCNSFYRPSRTAVELMDKNLYVTYSCATVRDLHTIPY
ncbi:5-methyltetrahydropteroyltriglutamate--homocysteine methyltransferase [Pedobacter sp. BAL39]|nr:5-methyltetrahydropteroyltriglutamate--homocysteine methyltransferase [Pedobacter sp. BAL39]